MINQSDLTSHLMPMDLQYFADDGDDGGSQAGSVAPTGDSATSTAGYTTSAAGSTESQATSAGEDMVNMPRAAFEARLKREAAKAAKEALDKAQEQQNEARKLEDMSELEKAQYKLTKITKEKDDALQSMAHLEMSQTATALLAEKDIVANEDILSFVVKDDAEETNAAINAFVDLVTSKAEAIAQEKLRGKVPNKRPVTGKQTEKSFGAQMAEQVNQTHNADVAKDFFSTGK